MKVIPRALFPASLPVTDLKAILTKLHAEFSVNVWTNDADVHYELRFTTQYAPTRTEIVARKYLKQDIVETKIFAADEDVKAVNYIAKQQGVEELVLEAA